MRVENFLFTIEECSIRIVFAIRNGQVAVTEFTSSPSEVRTMRVHVSCIGFLVDLFERGMPRGIPCDQISQNGRHVYHSDMPHMDHPSDNHHNTRCSTIKQKSSNIIHLIHIN